MNLNFDAYYNKNSSDRDVIRELRKLIRPEVMDRSHREVRHIMYREVLLRRAEMAQILNWYPTV